MGAWDLLKSERGVMQLLFLVILAVLLFTGASNDAVQTWALYAGGSTSIYTVAKSLKPNDDKTKPRPPREVRPASDVSLMG